MYRFVRKIRLRTCAGPLGSRCVLIVGAILAFACAGCLGPHAIRTTRQQYNEAVHVTANQQLLLNLVRLRYRDPPSFLELGSLSTQFSFDHSASIDGTLFDAARAPHVLGLDAGTDMTERPTATYAPLQGPEFVKRLISPLTLETIILIARSGWSLDRVLRMTVQELNGLENARTASGPIPEVAPRFAEFQSIVRTLRQLQLEDEIEFGFETRADPLSAVVPANSVSAEDMVTAAKEGWQFHNVTTTTNIPMELITSGSDVPWSQLDPEFVNNLAVDIVRQGLINPLMVRWDLQKGKFVVLEGHRSWMAIQLAEDVLKRPGPSNDSDPEWIQTILNRRDNENEEVKLDAQAIPCEIVQESDVYLSGTEESLIVRYKAEHDSALALLSGPRSFRGGKHELPLSIEPRSLLGTMYYLSHAIEVPFEHAEDGLVMFTRYEWGEPFDWNQVTGDLLRVRSCKRRPKCAAVAVKYRDHWFYIDDRDHDSKATFALLMQLFELKAGGEAAEAKPVLTLSVGQ